MEREELKYYMYSTPMIFEVMPNAIFFMEGDYSLYSIEAFEEAYTLVQGNNNPKGKRLIKK